MASGWIKYDGGAVCLNSQGYYLIGCNDLVLAQVTMCNVSGYQVMSSYGLMSWITKCYTSSIDNVMIYEAQKIECGK